MKISKKKFLGKIKKWLIRYLPAEIVSTATALGGALMVYSATQNDILTAFAGTWGENAGFYGMHLKREIDEARRRNKRDISLTKIVKSVVFEFGPAEILDSFVSRPLMLYIFPKIIGNLSIGIIAGKIVADLIVYIPIIFSYELKQFYKKKL